MCIRDRLPSSCTDETYGQTRFICSNEETQTNVGIWLSLIHIWNQGVTVLLYQAEQTHNFTLMHQQPADTHWVFVKYISLLVGADMHSID